MIEHSNYVGYGNYMELQLLNSLEDDTLNLKDLQENGTRGPVQGPRSLKDGLLEFVLERLDIYIKETQLDESLLENIEYKEGKVSTYYGTRFERNQKLRQKVIEIHHIKPMYSIKGEISVNPYINLVPLCSNCHKMIHRKMKEPLTIDELKRNMNYNFF